MATVFTPGQLSMMFAWLRQVNRRANPFLLLAWLVLSVACVELEPPWKSALFQTGGSTDINPQNTGGTTAINEDTLNGSGGVGGSTTPFSGGSKEMGDAPLLLDVNKDTIAIGGRDLIDSPIQTGGVVVAGGIQATGGFMNSGGVTTGGIMTGGMATGGVATGGITTGGSVDAGNDVTPDTANGTGGTTWPSGWSVQDISDDNDVSLAGTLVHAINLSGSSDVTINGVKFVRQNFPSSPFTMASGDTCSPSDTARVSTYEGFGVRAEPFSSLSTAYQSLLQNGFFNDGTASTSSSTARFNLTINGLTVGRSYLLQMWVNDSRADNLNQSNSQLYTTLSDGEKSLVLHYNPSGKAGGTGQYAVVVFEATATSKNFTMTGGNEITTGTPLATSLMMGYQVRQK